MEMSIRITDRPLSCINCVHKACKTLCYIGFKEMKNRIQKIPTARNRKDQ
jgi:hypothetical protein